MITSLSGAAAQRPADRHTPLHPEHAQICIASSHDHVRTLKKHNEFKGKIRNPNRKVDMSARFADAWHVVAQIAREPK
ncbi:hypothetical protein RA2_01503 [Roseovarius sp. A-2]|nr:hypothetical protein RA2_01503 [Roseovarius sp. A-2]